MDQEDYQLSILRILWTDYPAFYASLVPLVAWIVYLAWTPDWRGNGPMITPGARPFFLIMAILATCGSLSVLVWRVRLLVKTFRYGAQVRGKISKVELKRDHGRVEYTYIFDHQEYFSGTDVHRNARTKVLRVGDQVMLVVDRQKPSRAFIRHLYLSR
jgi:hypothetical protein